MYKAVAPIFRSFVISYTLSFIFVEPASAETKGKANLDSTAPQWGHLSLQYRKDDTRRGDLVPTWITAPNMGKRVTKRF